MGGEKEYSKKRMNLEWLGSLTSFHYLVFSSTLGKELDF
jgi:hypothetical protein